MTVKLNNAVSTNRAALNQVAGSASEPTRCAPVGPSDRYERVSAPQLSVTKEGIIMGPKGPVGSIDANLNFTLKIGNRELKGNLRDVLLAELSRRATTTPGMPRPPGDVVNSNGRQYTGCWGLPAHSGTVPGPVRTDSGTTTRGGTTGTSGTPGTKRARTYEDMPSWMKGPDGSAVVRNVSDIQFLPGFDTMNPQAAAFYQQKIAAALQQEQGSMLGIDGFQIRIAGRSEDIPYPKGTEAAGKDGSDPNLQLPIWTSEWSADTKAQWLARLAADKTPLPGKQAALAKHDAFMKELFGDATKVDHASGYQSGSIINMFTSGAIYDPKYYDLGRQEKEYVTGQFRNLLGRDPTVNELHEFMYLCPNMGVNESEFAATKEKFSKMTPAELQAVADRLAANPNMAAGNRLANDKYSDGEVHSGIDAYLQQHPGATEADIRAVAKRDYGINDAQLDRVKAKYYPSEKKATGTNTTGTNPKPANRYKDNEVADGVKAYLQDHPGATEAEIRQVAKRDYGISDDQLDRVKTTYFS